MSTPRLALSAADKSGIAKSLIAAAILIALYACGARARGADIVAASCRVGVDRRVCHETYCRQETFWGSGTLIAPGRVLTCNHVLVQPQRSRVFVVFAGQEFDARVIKRDPRADLALLAVPDPLQIPAPGRDGLQTVAPTEWNNYFEDAAPFVFCGFGPGAFRRVEAKFVAWTPLVDGKRSFFLSRGCRRGDSGGGVFDSRGQLVGVLWACEGLDTDSATDDRALAIGGEPLVDFLWGDK